MKNPVNESPKVDRLAYTLNEAAAALGVSYISAWRLAKRGKLRTVKSLRTHLVPVDEIGRFLREGMNQ